MGRPKHLARRAGSLCLLYLPSASLQHPIPISVMMEEWLLQPQTSHIHCHPIQPEPGLPTFQGCVSSQSTHCPAFMRALSSTLRCVILENTEEAWLKLFTLSKCVLPSLQHKGCRGEPLATSGHSVWENKLGDLWDLARNRITNHKRGACSTSINQRTKVIDQTVSLGRSGMWGKVCRILQSSGIAPNNDNTYRAAVESQSIPAVPHQ